MKIIYLINSFDTGGAEKAMVRICSSLKDKYKIKCVALHKGDGSLVKDLKANNLDYTFFRINKGNSPFVVVRDLMSLFKYLRKNRDAVLVCSLFHATIIGRLMGKLAGIRKIINWEHNQNLGGRFRKSINGLTMLMSSKVIADSKAVYETLRNNYKIKKNKLSYIPIGGIDVSQYSKHTKKRKELIISSVGRLHEQKGYDLLILVAKQVIQKHPEVIFKIAGEGEEKEKLQKQIKEYNLEKNFILNGFVRDIPAFLADSDIYVQPSRWEGLCMTVVEAMASSLPIVAFNVGGIKESVTNNKNGYLITPYNTKQFQDKLEKLIENNELRQSFGRESRKIAEEKYDIKEMVKKFERLI